MRNESVALPSLQRAVLTERLTDIGVTLKAGAREDEELLADYLANDALQAVEARHEEHVESLIKGTGSWILDPGRSFIPRVARRECTSTMDIRQARDRQDIPSSQNHRVPSMCSPARS